MLCLGEFLEDDGMGLASLWLATRDSRQQPKPRDIAQVTLAFLHCDSLKLLPSPSALDDGSRYGTGESIGVWSQRGNSLGIES